MEIVQGDFTSGNTAAILPGSFHPPTIAHYGLASAALGRVGNVVWTLPRAFPHKTYGRVSQADRLRLVLALTEGEPRFLVALSDGGLFIDMARELRGLRPDTREIFLLCGRDAAERIVNWHYPAGDSIESQLAHYRLLVAARHGAYRPPAALTASIEELPVETTWDDVSSTRVRDAIAAGEEWKPLVPAQIHELVEALYSPSRFDSRNVRSR
ncbi:MAG: hypothetical protein HYX27_10445 [Acidobacteria bacterium]|nr:hypothetical protein [Acidobacteriota bacterium]